MRPWITNVVVGFLLLLVGFYCWVCGLIFMTVVDFIFAIINFATAVITARGNR